MRIEKQLLVTGCGRSGTKYTAHLFRKIGLDLRHEQMGAMGTVSAPFVAYRSASELIRFNDFQRFGHVGRECPGDFTFEQVWHQTRDPLKTIGSLRDVMLMPVKEWAHAAFQQDRGIGKRGDLEWAARHWLVTNQHAERIADWTFKIEDIDTVFATMMDRLGLVCDVMPDVSRTMNRSQRTIKVFQPVATLYANITYPTYEDIDAIDATLGHDIRVLAERQGY